MEGVRREGTLIEARTITGAGNYRVTAAVTLVLAEALLHSGQQARTSPGCFEPHELFSPAELEETLRQKGLSVLPIS